MIRPALPLVAALAAAAGAHAMSMPPLIEPSAVAGAWTLSNGDVSCRLTLNGDGEGGAKGYGLEAGDCARVPGLKALARWRGGPDGITLVSSDGETVAFLGRRGDGFAGGGWTLSR